MAWWSRLLPAATFVVGLILGGLLIGLSSTGDSADDPADPEPSQTSATPTDEATAVVVPASCAEASREAETAVELMRDGAAAVRDVETERLAQVLNDLEDTQARLEKLSAECSQVKVESTS